MNNRWPPMLGVVGFDGGHKPAIALSIPRQKRADAEDGSAGGGDGNRFGACCYDDGTCDSPISQFDCTSAGGTYQGDGTDCDSVTCTGVCCEPGCVDDSTPNSCSDDGGTFQGFGTTCADDPPPCPSTGACCAEDGSCTITTEEGCTGTYQGDGTTCDPNPCETMPACCPDAYDAFDGSGRKFLTKTTTTTANVSYAPPGCPGPDSTASWTSTKTETYDPTTCDFTCNCTGSGEFDFKSYAGDCTITDISGTTSAGACGITRCEPNTGFDTISGCEVIVSGCGGTACDNVATGCFGAVSGVPTVDSATEQTTTYTNDISSDQFFHGTVVETLSDECTPGGFSPPP